MDPVGYAIIRSDFSTKNTGAIDPKSFTKQPVRILYFLGSSFINSFPFIISFN